MFGDVVNSFLNDQGFHEKLTTVAYSTIATLHSVEKRTENLINVLLEIEIKGAKKGKFIGGEYSFLDEHKKIIKSTKIAS